METMSHLELIRQKTLAHPGPPELMLMYVRTREYENRLRAKPLKLPSGTPASQVTREMGLDAAAEQQTLFEDSMTAPANLTKAHWEMVKRPTAQNSAPSIPRQCLRTGTTAQQN